MPLSWRIEAQTNRVGNCVCILYRVEGGVLGKGVNVWSPELRSGKGLLCVYLCIILNRKCSSRSRNVFAAIASKEQVTPVFSS